MSLHTLLLKSSMILIWVVVIYCFVCLSSVTKAQSIKADSLTVESHYKCPRKTVKRRSSVLGMCFSMWPDLAIFFMKLFCANVAQTFGNFGFFWKMSLGQLLAKILFIPTSGHTDTFEGSWDTFYKTKLLAVWSPVKLKHNIFHSQQARRFPSSWSTCTVVTRPRIRPLMPSTELWSLVMSTRKKGCYEPWWWSLSYSKHFTTWINFIQTNDFKAVGSNHATSEKKDWNDLNQGYDQISKKLWLWEEKFLKHLQIKLL